MNTATDENQDLKTFNLSTLLSLTSGKLLDPPGQRGHRTDGMYDLLAHLMKNDDTKNDINIGGDLSYCKAAIVTTFPELHVSQELIGALDKYLLATPKSPFTAIDKWIGELKIARPEMQDKYAVASMPKSAMGLNADEDRGMSL